MLSIRNISFSYPNQIKSDFVLKNVSFDVERGEFISLIGPNSSGKTTLLRLIDKIFLPNKGDIFLLNKNIRSVRQSELAKRIGFVPQDGNIIFPFTVLEIVLMGRSPHLKGLGFENKRDKDVAYQMMELTDITHLADKPITAISGGERQRAFIARALAQEPEIILLDEPNAHLDISHQVDIFDIIKALNKEKHITVISVSHDLNLVSTYSDRVVILASGMVYAIGKPEEVLTERNIKAVYQTNVVVDVNPITSSPRVTLLPKDESTLSRLKNQRTENDLSCPRERQSQETITGQRHNAPPSSPKLHKDRCNFFLSLTIISELITYGFMAYLRYKNQGLPLSAFDLTKMSNLVSTGLLLFMIASISAHLASGIRPKLSNPQALMVLSLLCLLLLGLSTFLDKHLKVTMSIIIGVVKTYEFAYSFTLNLSRKVPRSGMLQHIFQRRSTGWHQRRSRPKLPQFFTLWSKGQLPVLHGVKTLFLTLMAISALVAFSITYALLYRDDSDKYNVTFSAKADAAVVLGAAVWHGNRPSPVFRERINKGYELLHSGIVPVLVLTGGNAVGELPEAGVARKELLRMGVTDDQLIMESASSSTIEQIQFIRDELIAKRNFHRFIIISDHFHLRRAIDMCKFNNITAYGIASHNPLSNETLILYIFRDSVALIFYWLFGV